MATATAKAPPRPIVGPPGTVFVNDTGMVLYQWICDFQNSCGRCVAMHGMIGPHWPIPAHPRCRCRNAVLFPGHAAAPFVDFLAEISALPDHARARVIGRSNWAAVAAGLVAWSDVVTPARIRPFREVVERAGLGLGPLVDAGIAPAVARQAIEAERAAKIAQDTNFGNSEVGPSPRVIARPEPKPQPKPRPIKKPGVLARLVRKFAGLFGWKAGD